MKFTVLLLSAAALTPVFAQSSAVLTNVGYSVPAPMQVAPGQVTTFFFRGMGVSANGSLRSGQAAATPLPTNLGGISLRLTQSQGPAVDVPIFAVRQENDCADPADSSPACLVTSVKVQVPFELATEAGFNQFLVARMNLTVDGQSARSFPILPAPDNAHMITTCDLSWDTKYSSICDRQAYHANGHLVSQAEPAQLGETVVIYLYGMGRPAMQIPTGDASPAAAALDNLPGRVGASFSNLANSLSSVPRFPAFEPSSSPAAPIEFGGLTRGQVGLYQLNVTIPQSLDLKVHCGDFDNSIRSNANMRVITSQGVEGLGICVQ